MTRGRILLVDDDVKFFRKMANDFRDDFNFVHAETPQAMLKNLNSHAPYDLLVLDVALEGRDDHTGLYLIKAVQDIRPKLPIVMVSQLKDDRIGDLVRDWGGNIFLSKLQFDRESWRATFRELAGFQETSPASPATPKVELIGETPAIIRLREQLHKVANDPDFTVFLYGETGVGKEVAARFLHQHSPRKNSRLVVVNMAGRRGDTLKSELFGHKKGAFTGAFQDKDGFFRKADGGVLFLDEIAEIDEDIQVMLLRFLEDQIITPIGATEEIKLDLQIVSATNKNLEELVDAGKFREDLYHRLCQFEIEIPPLRERKSDIVLLMKHFIEKKIGTVNIQEIIPPDIFHKLINYPWRGNVRELSSSIKRMLLEMSYDGKSSIDFSCLPPRIQQYYSPLRNDMREPDFRSKTEEINHSPAKFRTRKEERSYEDLKRINEALAETKGDKGLAAEKLKFKGTDHLRARIKTIYNNYPDLIALFSAIREHYSTLFQS